MNFRKDTKTFRLFGTLRLPSLALKALVLSCLFLSSTYAFAAGAHEGPLPSFAEFILSKKIYWINFIVYSALVLFLISRAFPKAWNARRQNYIQALEFGKQKLLASELKLSEARNFHEAVPQKIAEIKVSLEKEVELETARLLTEAQEKAQQLQLQAQQNAEAEKRLVDQKFKKELIELAVVKARAKAQQAAEQSEVENKLRTKVVDRISSLIN